MATNESLDKKRQSSSIEEPEGTNSPETLSTAKEVVFSVPTERSKVERAVPIPIGPEVIAHKGKIIEVVVQQMKIGEKIVPFERARRSPGTRLLITSDTGKILLTREYRSEIGGFDYRLPGGKVYDTLDEYNLALKNNDDIIAKSKIAAKKEAREEVGMEAGDADYFHTSKCGATMEWDLHYFSINMKGEHLGNQDLEAGENIEVSWYFPEQVKDLALNGDISEDRSVAVLLRYLHATGRDAELKKNLNELGAGENLRQSIKTAGLDSLRTRDENLERLKKIDSIIFVGSSSTGKSTLVDVVRDAISQDPELSARVSVPKRVVTRPQRENDNLVENIFITPEAFSAMVEKGKIGLRWIRKMEGTRTESYGFLAPESGEMPIYSANNAVINNKESLEPADILEKSLIIAVYAPEPVREQRLVTRSPDLVQNKPEEAAYRLADRAINMFPEAHIVVKNFGRYENKTKADILALIKLLKQGS